VRAAGDEGVAEPLGSSAEAQRLAKMILSEERVEAVRVVKGVAEVRFVEGSRMDKLESMTVSILEIPEAAAPTPKALGRLGALWLKLTALQPGHAEAVQCRSQAHANNTLSHMRKRAKGAGYQINDRRVGDVLYLWLSCDAAHMAGDGESSKAA
jgi:hypothetical protein